MARARRRKGAKRGTGQAAKAKTCPALPMLAFDNPGDYADLALEDEEIRSAASDLALDALARALAPWFAVKLPGAA